MSIQSSKNKWALFLLLLAGIVIGGFIGELTKDVSWLQWMSYSKTFGLASPVVLDLSIIVITFGLTISINIASIIGVLAAILIYKLI